MSERLQVYSEQPATRIIEVCGGEDAIASALKLHVSTVHRWRWPKERGGTGGWIPTRRQTKLLEWARESGKPLTADMFFAA